MGDIAGYLNKQKLNISEIKLTPSNLAEVVKLIDKGEISNAKAKEKLPDLLEGKAPKDIFAGEKLITDPAVLEPLIDEAIAGNPKEVEKYRSGKTNVKGFFVGQVLKKTGKRADPKLTNQLVDKKLKALVE